MHNGQCKCGAENHTKEKSSEQMMGHGQCKRHRNGCCGEVKPASDAMNLPEKEQGGQQ